MQVRDRKIPCNFTKGRSGLKPTAIVLHVMEGTLSGTDSWFRNPKAQASTHYGIGKNGEIWQWVNEYDMAYGNGRVASPTWSLITKQNPNLYTVSIEHEGYTGQPWTDAMYQADVWLIKQIAKRWDIPLDRDHVIGHREIYGKKPNCPGAGLDFKKLMSLLNESEIKNKCVKGSEDPKIYWVDAGGVRHHIPTWETFVEFFKGEPTELLQSEVEALPEGKPMPNS